MWRELAACAGSTIDFFATEGSRESDQAVRVCETCRVAAECLSDSLRHENEAADTWGVRGGLVASERQTIRRVA